ncbi:GNAT family N-acetyltransferase [Pedobacter insulae]|uniref:Acetyltransferase (GNAT) domain-containing protein n=1 Tax=Pedobacter insulae TaxID=414048 RepID=A0A1I2UM97_9SPHI|nr:GNAT family N-acetyltransferase [Pedobacter insulae]SFG78282.1 Acetyltransferase (GNAT) domain-containing protein [Pedobacter insulae]
MHILQENPAYVYKLNPDLAKIDWDHIISLFYKIEWKHRKAHEIEAAFKLSTTTIFIYKEGQVIAFGRVVGDGRYYAMLADIVVDPDYQGQGLGKYVVTALNNQLIDYHFVNLSAAPGADPFYKSMGWKKQTTAFIWPQGPKQLRQHCEVEE